MIKKILLGTGAVISGMVLAGVALADTYVLPDATSTANIGQQGLSYVWANISQFLTANWGVLIALTFIFIVIGIVGRKLHLF